MLASFNAELCCRSRTGSCKQAVGVICFTNVYHNRFGFMTSIRKVRLLHNPKAGDGDYIIDELVEMIQSIGLVCEYTSVKKKGWRLFPSGTELIIIVGGDGTVREVMKKIVRRQVLEMPMPLALLPSGTANNFAKTLGVSADVAGLERSIVAWNPKRIDVGTISGLKKSDFFLEGFGCGLIPKLIKHMERVKLSSDDAADHEIVVAWKKLTEIAEQYVPKRAKVRIDGGHIYEEEYLAVEVLNIRSIGPNLILAPNADPGDGRFEVVMLKAVDRQNFLDYLKQSLENPDRPVGTLPWKVVTANREISLECENRLFHIDDELLTNKKQKNITIEVRSGIVDFIT